MIAELPTTADSRCLSDFMSKTFHLKKNNKNLDTMFDIGYVFDGGKIFLI